MCARLFQGGLRRRYLSSIWTTRGRSSSTSGSGPGRRRPLSRPTGGWLAFREYVRWARCAVTRSCFGFEARDAQDALVLMSASDGESSEEPPERRRAPRRKTKRKLLPDNAKGCGTATRPWNVTDFVMFGRHAAAASASPRSSAAARSCRFPTDRTGPAARRRRRRRRASPTVP